MTIRKQYPARSYDTFHDDRDDSVTQSPTSYRRGGDDDKSRSAAAEAQRLGSQGSWADNFAGGTPATNPTPAASTVDGDEVRDIRYPHISSDGDPSDPPPVYTPSASTQVGAQSPAAPASPVAARSNLSPVPELRGAHRPRPTLSAIPITPDTTIIITTTTMILTSTMKMRTQTQTDFRSSCNSLRGGIVYGSEPPVEGLVERGAAAGAGRRYDSVIATNIELADGRYQLPSFGQRPSHAPWPPPEREHREHETFRSISGTYQLYDLLDLSTTAGSITVTVDVQPGDKPAVLRLSTSAGSVNVKMVSGGGFFSKPTVSDAAKSRTLVTEISTYAGSVSGSLVHGNGGSTSISTNAGSISVTIFAVGVSELDPQSNISTISNSGGQHIKVVPALSSTEAIRAIEAAHTIRGSGSMNIAYPPQWEGMVHVSTHGHGSIDAHGAGLVVRKESSRELYGYRGEKEGKKVEISEIGSGSVKFTC
ncbi:hypothetical protein AYL99_06503 [Fonsecaea erecta]|uniref:Uncharacterized protein n=1 Tax=Fonsecaea erecta TaxID=1367422 RepID=A0A178ZJJ2_9EURO|nr:hypothetical protein AYL99_06503 [Fonsecaea erecta]OAP59205.1 hypothetical protein AYL99_06503 [Fonsecaea erecta]